MSLFSKLFGGGSGGRSTEPEPVDHKGFRITPTLIPEGNRFRLSARIDKEVGGETKTHTLVRADVLDDRETAERVAIDKAKQVIEEQGDRLFG